MPEIPVISVDDDPTVLRLVRAQVGRAGYTVTSCHDGQAAFEAVVDKQPVILLADWDMPGWSGLDLTRNIRNALPRSAAYIILLTGRSDADQMVIGLDAGADDYVTKPALRAELLARIRAGERMIRALASEAERAAVLDAIIRHNPAGMILRDAKTGNIVSMNETACAIAGVEEREAVGRPCCQFDTPDPTGAYPALEGAHQTDRRDSILYTSTGRRVPVLRSVVPITVEGRCQMLESFIDIRTMKEEQRVLARQAMESRLVHRAAAMAAETRSVEEAMKAVIDMICETIGWPVGHVYLPDPEGSGDLIPSSIWHLSEPADAFVKATMNMRFAPGVGLPGRILESGGPECVRSVDDAVRFPRSRLFDDLGVEGAFGFPVKVRGEVVAVPEFFSRQAIVPDPDLLAIMRTVGEQIGRVFERKRAEAYLRLQGGALETAANAIFITNRNGDIIWANAAVTELTGYDRDALLGANMSMFDSGRRNAESYEDIWRTVRSGRVWHGERVGRRQDGSLCDEDVTITPIRNEGAEITHFIVIKQDISGKRRMERVLRESEARHRAIMENAKDAVITSDSDGVILFWNPAAESIFGYTAEEVVGRSMFDYIVPARYHEAKRKAFAAFAKTGQGDAIGKTLELSALRKDGTEFPVEVSFSAYRENDRFIGVALARDITERKRAEEETAARRQVEEERDQLRAALSAHGRVIGVVGHELRTPLAGVRAMAEFLISAGSREIEEFDVFLRNIHSEIVRMSGTVNDLLEVARLNSGVVNWNWDYVSLAEACDAAMAPIRCLIDHAKVKLIRKVDPPGLWMNGDADAIRRLALNLLNNAAKHTTEGSIRLTATQREEDGRNWVILEVRDTGEGISEEIAERLGTPFALNAGVTGGDCVKGSGLGLAICKGI
ncbi:MAG: PAS domain S-box protein, partial [Phycisphaerae bacterium]